MKEKSRIYYYLILGAFGSLTGWFLASILIKNPQVDLLLGIIYGGILGSVTGLTIFAYDGLINRSWKIFIRFGWKGLLLGLIAGALAFPITHIIYEKSLLSAGIDGTHRGFLFSKFSIGLLCWLLFGGLIGLGEGIGKGTQIWKGILGGVIGGILGGLVYETYRVLNSGSINGDTESYRKMQFLALSLTFLGGMVGIAIAAVTSLLKGAELAVQDGKLEGRVYDISKYVDSKHGKYRPGIIGSDEWEADIYLAGDPEIMPNHAKIFYFGGAPTLAVSQEAEKKGKLFLNGYSISSSPLSNGDRITVGSTTLIYSEKKTKSDL